MNEILSLSIKRFQLSEEQRTPQKCFEVAVCQLLNFLSIDHLHLCFAALRVWALANGVLYERAGIMLYVLT